MASPPAERKAPPTPRAARHRARADRRRARATRARPCRGRGRLEAEAVEVAVAVGAQARARADRARAVRRDRGAGDDCFRQLVGGAACRGARQRRAATTRPRAARGDRPQPRLRRPPGGAGRARHRAPATAASNGPTAASIRDRAATERRSQKPSTAISRARRSDAGHARDFRRDHSHE